jgi:hypothetical protein
VVLVLLSPLTAQGTKEKKTRRIRAGEEGSVQVGRSYVGRYAFRPPPFYFQGPRCVRLVQEIEKYNAVQPHHCSMLRYSFASARRALALLLKMEC